jgi:hypothetical protein
MPRRFLGQQHPAQLYGRHLDIVKGELNAEAQFLTKMPGWDELSANEMIFLYARCEAGTTIGALREVGFTREWLYRGRSINKKFRALMDAAAVEGARRELIPMSQIRDNAIEFIVRTQNGKIAKSKNVTTADRLRAAQIILGIKVEKRPEALPDVEEEEPEWGGVVDFGITKSKEAAG